jgi:Ni,Fe-hydrogenase I small subunit
MKTSLVKDLKYNPNNVFLIGKNPPEPERLGNVILFGDCAINTTKNSGFRTIKKELKKNIIDDTKDKILKKQKSQKKPKTKFKTNKKIMELPGCPPNIINCMNMFMKYYGKKNLPNLSLFKETLETWFNPKDIKNLRALGVL